MGFILFTIPGRRTACVENYWSCELIVQEEGIVNFQLARIQNIEPLELFLDLPNNISLEPKNKGWNFSPFPFKLKSEHKQI